MEIANNVILESSCHDVEFQWTIADLKLVPDGKLNFPLRGCDKCKLNLDLILKYSLGSSKKLKIGLSKTQAEPHNFKVFFYFEFCDSRGEIFSKDSLEIVFLRSPQEVFSREITKPTSATSGNNRARPLHGVSVRGHVVVKQFSESVKMDAESINESVIQLQQDFYEVLQSGVAADITVDVENEIFNVHRFVLGARSPVFQKMLMSDMCESRQKRITIKDIGSEVFKDFLQFLYTGDIGKPTFDTTCELYSVGDKYEVGTLQNICHDYLISYLYDDTVSRILKLADMHNDRQLEERAVTFICENFTSVAGNSDWETLIIDRPDLVSRVLQQVSNFMSVVK